MGALESWTMEPYRRTRAGIAGAISECHQDKIGVIAAAHALGDRLAEVFGDQAPELLETFDAEVRRAMEQRLHMDALFRQIDERKA